MKIQALLNTIKGMKKEYSHDIEKCYLNNNKSYTGIFLRLTLWFVNNYGFSTHKDSVITNYPLEGVKGDEIQAMIERLCYVGVRSDEIMEEISKHEFEPKETKVIKTHATLFD